MTPPAFHVSICSSLVYDMIIKVLDWMDSDVAAGLKVVSLTGGASVKKTVPSVVLSKFLSSECILSIFLLHTQHGALISWSF